ncbi:EamA family transporter [Actinosynnema mirum]|uniref:EamA domain-containing protein n=1 Tax=Actinosynnema mirum (strain ATCC 29888 / DSM 43827 / JCM 3225 / NBRC 14064 / NCIMB 13271 / NRRL B-12336 / IMRU 3971 / 101) TaxID=446462 RepID=C6WER6_ACTMD|nr:EamA family transporter [Actinosynnema mirum]ACU39691.1 protein of unknown function DUF6 transmembrane [Actinosynnema mirum DSM 43827]
MKPAHSAVAVLVAAIWGVNFVVVKVGLAEFPPLLFSALRFLLAAVPAVFFLGGPRVAWRWVFGVGLALGVVKFGLLFTGMHAGMPAGLSSLVLQSQVVFTVALSAVVLGERPRPAQVLGLAVATTGFVVIALDYRVSSPVSALLLVVGGALAWGVANVLTRKAQPPDSLRFIVWVSAVAVLPLLALSLLVEGPEADLAALRGMDWAGAGSLLFVAWVSTLLGFALWGFLLRTYPAPRVVPFALLVPVAGMLSGWLLLDEEVTAVRLGAAGLVVAGMGAATLTRPRSRRRAEPVVEAVPV